VSSHFGFRVGSVIGSSSVESFWISGHIKSGRVGYRIIQCRVIPVFGHIVSDQVGQSSRVGSGSAH
jgi:hypothetical protein